MKRTVRTVALALLVAATVCAVAVPARAAEVDADATAALDSLYGNMPAAKALAAQSKAVLVFPNIVKAGFLVGAQYGEGTLFKSGRKAGNYNVVAGSYGFQAGVQSFGYAMFLMTDEAVEYLDRSGGWEVGAGPSVVVLDTGAARNLTTSTMRSDVYAFVFDQKGLMAGVGLQGSKITRVNR